MTNRKKIFVILLSVFLVAVGVFIVLSRPKNVVINSGLAGPSLTVRLHLYSQELPTVLAQDQQAHHYWRHLKIFVRLPIIPGTAASAQNINSTPGYHVASNLEIGTTREFTVDKSSGDIFAWYNIVLSKLGYHLEITTASDSTQMRAYRSQDGTTFIWVLVTQIPGTTKSDLSFSVEYLIPQD